MASSLAASIQKVFGISPELVDGHNGIYEVAVNGNVIYSTKSTCSTGFPADQEIFQGISMYLKPLISLEEVTFSKENLEDFSAPYCDLPSQSSDKSEKLNVIQNVNLKTSGCGCSSQGDENLIDVESTSNSCCG